MKDDSTSYYESQEFCDILNSYENMLSNGAPTYLDSIDIANIAEYYSMNGDIEKSNEAIEFGLRIHPSNTELLISKANNILRIGHKDEARVIAESIQDTNHQELLFLKGKIDLAYDNAQQADKFFASALEQSNEDLDLLNDIIVSYIDYREFELAQKWMDIALITAPDSRSFIELQADLYFASGQNNLAIEWYNHLLDEFPYETYYWEQLGHIHYSNDDFVKARECFEFIEAISPGYKMARIWKACCIYSMEEWQEAYDIYQELIDDGDDLTYSYRFFCGRCKFGLGEYEEAYKLLLEALLMMKQDETVLDGMYIELYYYLALSAHKNGKYEEAQDYLYKGLELDPEDDDLLSIVIPISLHDDIKLD